MMLCLREGRNDPQGLERVLPVLDRRLYDGGDGGVVFYAGLGTEASADLDFGLGRPELLLAVVVGGRHGRVGKESEDVVPMFSNALFEFVQCGILPVFAGIYGRSRKQLVKPGFHPSSDIRPRHTLIALVDGVSEKVKHVQAPGIVRKGLHRIGEVPQQVGDAYLVVIHPDFVHEVGRPAVCDPDRPAPLLLVKCLFTTSWPRLLSKAI